MGKYNDDNIKENTIMKVDNFKPCTECGEPTRYIDYIYECRVCSEECNNIITEFISTIV